MKRWSAQNLAAATLGLVKVPAAPVEASIALSMVFLASELLRAPTGRSDFTQSYPWLIAFGFGLLHGLGFAGALAEIGLPHGEIPLALFSFNVGVEVGQLAFKRRFRGRCKVHFWRNRDLSLGSRNVRFRGTVKSRSATEMGRTPEGPLSSDLPTSARGAHGLRRPHIAAYDVDGRQGTKPIGVNV